MSEELLRDPRYAYLLQPIRDLTKNWNIDLAQDLERYLEEVEHLEIVFDGGKSTLNFSQAALLIQGSTSVYGRKVDYLHDLTAKVLDAIVHKKKQIQMELGEEGSHGAPPRVGAGAAADEDDFDDTMLQPVHITEGRNIDRKSERRERNTNILLPPISLALMPLTNEDKHNDHQLKSIDGEVIGNMRDFKVNTCFMHSSGYMLLDPSYAKDIPADILQEDWNQRNTQGVGPPGNLPEPSGIGTDPVDQDTAPMDQDVPEEAPADVPEGDGPADERPYNDDDVDNDVPPLEGSNHGDDAAVNNYAMEEANEPGQPLITAAEQAEEEAKEEKDPWRDFLDPYDELNAGKPFKKSKSWKIPDSVKQPDVAQEVQTIEDFLKEADRKPKERRLFKKLQSYIPYPEFEGIYMDAGAKNKTKKSDALTGDGVPTDDQGADSGQEEEVDDGGEPDDDGAADDMMADGELDGDEGIDELPQPFSIEDVSMTYERLVNQHVEGYLESVKDTAPTSELTQRVACWKEKVQGILESEKDRPPFDMHEYGSKVLSTFSEEKPEVEFRDMCQNQQPGEVCRMFVSALQLANAGNVELTSEGMDQLTLKFLHDKRRSEQLHDDMNDLGH